MRWRMTSTVLACKRICLGPGGGKEDILDVHDLTDLIEAEAADVMGSRTRHAGMAFPRGRVVYRKTS